MEHIFFWGGGLINGFLFVLIRNVIKNNEIFIPVCVGIYLFGFFLFHELVAIGHNCSGEQ